VNDHSTDAETAEVLEKLARTDCRVRILENPGKNGVAAARNHGIRAAQGEWIAFLDADDTWTPDSLATRLKAFEHAPGALCVSSDYVRVYDDGRREVRGAIEATRRDDGWGPLLGPAFSTNAPARISNGIEMILLHRTIFLTSSVIVHRSLLVKAGEFDERLSRGEDTHLWLRFALYSDWLFVPSPLVCYAFRSGSLTRNWDARKELRTTLWELLLRDRRFTQPYHRRLCRARLAKNCHRIVSEARLRREPALALRAAWKGVSYNPFKWGPWRDLFCAPLP
jgi:glycosyltransferase involved in cell wall biosynthesis